MRIIINVVLSLAFVLSSYCIAFAADSKKDGLVEVNDGKQIIFQRDDTVKSDNKDDNAISASSGATFDHDGSVYNDGELYYMKGWSTAVGSTGVDLYHYTTADFANLFGLRSYGAVTKWGTGKVWATSEGVGWDVYGSTYGRIRYGL